MALDKNLLIGFGSAALVAAIAILGAVVVVVNNPEVVP